MAAGKEIREVLAGQHQFEGTSGMINFSSTGDPIKTAYISTWQNGDIVTLYTIDPTADAAAVPTEQNDEPKKDNNKDEKEE